MPPDLKVGLLQDLQRLVIIGLCLSNGLKHLDGLENLAMLFVRQGVFQHSVRKKLEACPCSEGNRSIPIKFANLSIV